MREYLLHFTISGKDKRRCGGEIGSPQPRTFMGFEERSFVAMLLRTDSLIGNLVNNNTPPPPCFS
jgi:hypothetical protein